MFRDAPSLVVVLSSLLFLTGCHEELGIGKGVGERVEVASFALEGVEALDESRLRSVLATKPTPWLPWAATRYFDRDAFEQDLERIVAFYEDQGYPDAEVVSYDVDLSDDRHSVNLRVAVREGDPLVVTGVRLQNFDVLSEDVRQRLRNELPLTSGTPLVLEQAIASRERAVDALRNHGYPFATVEMSRQEAPDGVAIELRAHPGPLSSFGPIEIVGNRSVDDNIISRQLQYRPGELFRQTELRDSVRELYALELFQFATIERPDDGLVASPSGNLVPTRVTVTEGDHRRFEFSFGYGTEEKGRVEAEWRHVNFYGGARSLGLHAKWSWLDRGVEGTFVQPYLFSPNLSLALQGQAWYADEPAYDTLSRGGRATVTHSLGRNSSASGSLLYQFQSSRIANEALEDPSLRDELIALGLNPTTGVQDGALLALAASARLLRIDDELNPTRGYIASIDLEQAGGWMPSTYNYFGALGELSGYYTPHQRVTVAARARYGAVDPFGPPSDVPFFKRFFLGGAGSLRGWGRYEVAPLSGFGLPIGGNSLFESNVELRSKVWGNLGVVGFVDAGNVWSDPWAADFGNLLYDAGPGLRYQTPVGPVRLDFAYQLNRLEGLRIDDQLQQRRWRIHFSIGQAF